LLQDKPVLLVENEPNVARNVTRSLALDGYRVLHARSVREAIEQAKVNRDSLRFIALDLGLPDYKPYSREETDDGNLAGIFLIREFAQLVPKARIYVKTQVRPSAEAHAAIKFFESVVEFSWQGYDTDAIKKIANGIYSPNGISPVVFVVHGRDAHALAGLTNFLDERLELGRPIILRDVKGDNRTIIEKFEECAREADLVFVLMTPDDTVGTLRRARQNVIFELGYFMGAFGRRSDKLIILKSGDVEVPSDINGMWSIDVSNGFTSDTERKIRNQLQGRWGMTVHPERGAPRSRTRERTSGSRARRIAPKD
jgi:predicted nucleotide-binding protein